MLKNVLKFEFAVGSKLYHLLSDVDATIPELKDVLFQLSKIINQIEDNLKAQEAQKAQAAAQAPSAPSVVEPMPEAKAE